MVFAFDLDDTLYTEMDFVRSGYRAVSAILASGSTLDAGSYFEGISRHRPLGFEWALEKYFQHSGKDIDMSVDKMIELYRAHTPDISLRSGAGEALARLKDGGHTLVLITDGSTRHQRSKIRALGLEDIFDDILISEETGGDKTTDVPWSIVEKRYGGDGQRMVYIGDNMTKDFHLPRLRGWRTIMMLDTAGSNVFAQDIVSTRPEYRPDTIMKSFKYII